MSTQLSRSDVVTILAHADLRQLAPKQRADLLTDSWYSFSLDETLLQNLPPDLRLEIDEGEPPTDPDLSRYDVLVLPGLQSAYIGVTNSYLVQRLTRLGYTDVRITGEPEPLQPCPCCGYKTLASRDDYLICPVCFWEDASGDDPEQYSDANRITLAQGRRNFEQFGACDRAARAHVDSTPNKYPC
jgi:hypothetical protein